MSWSVQSAQNERTIKHYGVLGMKWGVRKEHMPKGRERTSINPKSHAKSSANARNILDSISKIEYEDVDSKENRNENGYMKTIRTKNDSTTISVAGSNFRKEAMELIDSVTKKAGYLPEEEASRRLKELPKIKTPTSEEFNAFAVNKGGPTPERLVNCFECVIATEMRNRGYDVQANTKEGGRALEFNLAFDMKDSFDIRSTSAEEAYKRMEVECLKYGEGARGGVGVRWFSGSGHAMTWEVKNGELIMIDNQAMGRDAKAQFMECDPSNITVVRFDNAEVRPGVMNYIENYDGLTEEEMAELEAEKERQKKMADIARASREDMKKRREAERQERLARENYEKFFKKKSVGQKIKEGTAKAAEAISKVAKATGDKIAEYASKGAKYVQDFFDKF